MLIVERLKAARKACKYTQQQVADMLAIDRSTYAYYELGVFNPPLATLSALAALFNTDVGWLMGDDSDKFMWKAPDNYLDLLAEVKEKKITELSETEKLIIGLFRLAENNKNDDKLIEILKEAASNDEIK